MLLVLDNFDDLETKTWIRLEHKLASLSEKFEGLRILLSYTKSSENTFTNFLKNSLYRSPDSIEEPSTIRKNQKLKQEMTYQDTPFPVIVLKSLSKK